MLLLCLGLCLLIGLPVRSALLTHPSQLPQPQYDFVIVGAGAGGGVLANRLTENPNFSILVIEAGVTNVGQLASTVPFLAPTIQLQSPITWNYTTVPQRGLNDRVLFYSRGKILGGSTAINFLTYNRGSNDEYNCLARITGDNGWSWKSMEKYYLKSTRLVPPSDHHSTVGQAEPAVHGYGPVTVSVASFKLLLDSLVVKASKILGGRFPFNLDMQSGNSIGFSWAQSAIDSTGKRSTSATAYIQPAIGHKNLDVLIQTQVTRLIQTGTPGKGLSFSKVEFVPNATSKRYTVTAKKEVILAAGSINTPQILLLSGIGNKTTLESMGIKPLVNLPDVGQNLQDHPILSNYFAVNSNTTWDNVLRNASIVAADLDEWTAMGQGLFANAPGTSLGFLRLPKNAAIFRQFPDPAASTSSFATRLQNSNVDNGFPGPFTGHTEMIFADGFAASASPQPPTGNFITVNTAIVSPLSRGSVTLASTDPFAFPNIDPAFLTSPFDVFAMTQVIKDVRQFLSASPFKGFIAGPFGEVSEAKTNEEIAAAARDGVVTIWHPMCTARMSPENANWGVVDSKLLMKGVTGLRIVDASIFPIIPAAHPTGVIYAVAKHAADLIKATWDKSMGWYKSLGCKQCK